MLSFVHQGHLLGCSRHLIKLKNVRMVHGIEKLTEEYYESPKYPKLHKYPTKHAKEKADLAQTIKELKTVEEKQSFINQPKYYGWYTCVADASSIMPQTLDFLQFATNTTILDGTFPDCYGSMETNTIETNTDEGSNLSQVKEELPIEIEARRIAKELEPHLKNILLTYAHHHEFHLNVENDKIPYHENFAALPEEMGIIKTPRRVRIREVVVAINRLIMTKLKSSKKHLRESTMDYEPRTSAFWFRDGVLPDMRMIRKKAGLYASDIKRKIPKEYCSKVENITKPYDRAIQFQGDSILQIRHNKMISPFIQDVSKDDTCQEGPVPQWNYAPQMTGYHHKFLHGVNLPGFWTTSSNRFVNLSLVNPMNMMENLSNELAWTYPDCNEEMILSKALISSFAVLMPVACYQGFDSFNDPTQPFTTQTIVTDGHKFRFTLFQMNKTDLITEGENLKTRNVMWQLPEQQLYESIDENGIHGFNSKVLENLIKFYLLEPTVSEEDIDNLDYLGEVKYAHNIRNNYNREYFLAFYKFMISNRPRARPKPAVLPYQKIHMIDHPDQMFMAGNREQPWFRMAKIHPRGREHWHPEFKRADIFYDRKVKKFREHETDFQKKKVFAPVPHHEDNDQ